MADHAHEPEFMKGSADKMALTTTITTETQTAKHCATKLARQVLLPTLLYNKKHDTFCK